MTLVDLLARDLLGWREAASDRLPRRVLLWPDPEHQFSRLAPHVEPVLLALGTQLLCIPSRM